jgi:hypothetical protein
VNQNLWRTELAGNGVRQFLRGAGLREIGLKGLGAPVRDLADLGTQRRRQIGVAVVMNGRVNARLRQCQGASATDAARRTCDKRDRRSFFNFRIADRKIGSLK